MTLHQSDSYTMQLRLCDEKGMVSAAPCQPGAPGTSFDPNLTYRKLHDNLRARNSNPDTRKPYEGPDYACTGSAHLAQEHIRCTNPIHNPAPALDAALRTGPAIVVGSYTYISPESVTLAMTAADAEEFRKALSYANSVIEYHGPQTEIAAKARERLTWAMNAIRSGGTAG